MQMPPTTVTPPVVPVADTQTPPNSAANAFEVNIVTPLKIRYNEISSSSVSMALYFVVLYVAISALKNVVQVPMISGLTVLQDVRAAALIGAVAGPYVLQTLASQMGLLEDSAKPDQSTLLVAIAIGGLAMSNMLTQGVESVGNIFSTRGLFATPAAITLPPMV